MSKILIDTNLYIHFLRSGAFHEQIKALYTFRAQDIYFSSVVIEELLQGTLDAKGRKYVETLYRPFEKVGRIITPYHEDWKKTGKILSQLKQNHRSIKDKINKLINDTLIALSALRIGAIIYTEDEKDFTLLKNYIKQLNVYVIPATKAEI